MFTYPLKASTTSIIPGSDDPPNPDTYTLFFISQLPCIMHIPAGIHVNTKIDIRASRWFDLEAVDAVQPVKMVEELSRSADYHFGATYQGAGVLRRVRS